MAKMTVSSIRAQIALLEAKSVRLAQVEAKASVKKVRALMNELGVTLEHLGAKVSGTAGAAKDALLAEPGSAKKASAKKAATKRAGVGTPKYRHPKTGQTWTRIGRAPAWLASVKNRTTYLIDRPAAESTSAPVSAPANKSAKKPTSKTAKAVKSAKTIKNVQEEGCYGAG
jgi:DNA-binding protein H-NS